MGMSINDCIFHLFPILCVFPRYTLLVSDDLFYLGHQIPVYRLLDILYILEHVVRIGRTEKVPIRGLLTEY